MERVSPNADPNCRLIYDTSPNRRLSKDPIGFAAGDANLYRYVGNQPTTLTDPSGLEPPSIGQNPNPVPDWQKPFVYDPRDPDILYEPGLFGWSVGNIYHRLGFAGAVNGVRGNLSLWYNDPGKAAINCSGPGFIYNFFADGGPEAISSMSDLEKQDIPAQIATGLVTGQIVGQSGLVNGMPYIGKPIGMQQRLAEFYRRLRAQGPASSADDALARIRRTLDEVEDEMSGVTKQCPPPGPGMSDGRMYPPLDDFVKRLPDGRIIARSRGHRIEIGPDGETRIINLQTGGVDVEF